MKTACTEEPISDRHTNAHMHLRKLYRTIENLASQRTDSDEELLASVLNEIVLHQEIPIKGGRLWKLDPHAGHYQLIHQAGDIEKIREGYILTISDYPMFVDLAKQRTVLGKETDTYLQTQGIRNYSATGIGEKIRWQGQLMYPYVIAVSADVLDEDLTYTLGIISSALTSVLKGRHIERRARLLERDLDRARDIQARILPEHGIRFHNYELYGISVPDRIVGGDFFDYIQLQEDSDRLGIVIGDAASKGLSAAAQALYISGALRMGVAFQTKMGALISRLNRLVNRVFPDEQFVTLFYGELFNDKNGLLLYANAGHNAPLIMRARSLEIEELSPTGQIIGPFPRETYRTESTLLKKGDILLLYTDGVSEAMNQQEELFGTDRLGELLVKHRDLSTKEIAEIFIEEAEKFDTHPEHSDDKTVVVIKRME